MSECPRAVVFDVFETVFSMKSLVPRLVAVGLKPESLQLWFAKTLRDGFALAAANAFVPFQSVAKATLEGVLADHGLPSSRIEQVLEGFAELDAEPDVEPAFALLRQHNVRILTLSNGGREGTQTLLRRAGLEAYVEQQLSIDDIECWKPRPEIYRHTVRAAQVEPARLALVAAHAWDVQGAMRVGLTGGWVSRQETLYSSIMPPPDARGKTLVEVCQMLLGLAAE